MQNLTMTFSLIIGMTLPGVAFGSRAELAKFLTSMTLGNNGFNNRVLSPAKSLNLNLSESDRTEEINLKFVNELDEVLTAFQNSAEDKKLENVRAVAKKYDPELLNSGANIQFFNISAPSAAYSRVLIMIDKKANPSVSAEAVLKSFSSYKRSALPSTHIYEYSDAGNIVQSKIKTSIGSDTSWKLPLAAEPIKPDQYLVLKKCRQIFGWKCVTSLYRTGQLGAGSDNLKFFYAGIYDLVANQDHPDFAGDKRSFNQITGSTALYTVKESAKWLLLYGIDSQWNQNLISFTTLIADEYVKDSKRIIERLSVDLKIPVSDIVN